MLSMFKEFLIEHSPKLLVSSIVFLLLLFGSIFIYQGQPKYDRAEFTILYSEGVLPLIENSSQISYLNWVHGYSCEYFRTKLEKIANPGLGFNAHAVNCSNKSIVADIKFSAGKMHIVESLIAEMVEVVNAHLGRSLLLSGVRLVVVINHFSSSEAAENKRRMVVSFLTTTGIIGLLISLAAVAYRAGRKPNAQ